MKVTKFGHCCLLIEENGVRILTDPGIYSTAQNLVNDLDYILITHEHADHFHLDSIKTILTKNRGVTVITNKSVGLLLEKEGIAFNTIEHQEQYEAKGVMIQGFGKEHAVMHHSLKPLQNTGYFIANRLFYPGDTFINPGKQIVILALPVAGPWMKLSEAIDYAVEIKPKICFPVHDGILKQPGTTHRIPPQVLTPMGINFIVPELEKEYEF